MPVGFIHFMNEYVGDMTEPLVDVDILQEYKEQKQVMVDSLIAEICVGQKHGANRGTIFIRWNKIKIRF